MDPPRPFDGRISKTLIPKPPQSRSAAAANAPENPNYIRYTHVPKLINIFLVHLEVNGHCFTGVYETVC